LRGCYAVKFRRRCSAALPHVSGADLPVPRNFADDERGECGGAAAWIDKPSNSAALPIAGILLFTAKVIIPCSLELVGMFSGISLALDWKYGRRSSTALPKIGRADLLVGRDFRRAPRDAPRVAASSRSMGLPIR